MDEDDWYDRYYEDGNEYQEFINREPSRAVRGGGYWELRHLMNSANLQYDRPDEKEYNATGFRPICNARK